MTETIDYYRDMSWGKMEITYEILDQTVLKAKSTNPSLSWTKRQCENYIREIGYRLGRDYDGIIMIFPPAQSGDLARSGGKECICNFELFLKIISINLTLVNRLWSN